MNEGGAKDFYAPGLMDLTAYRLVEIEDDDRWRTFVESSAQGTLYAYPEYLRSLGHPIKYLVCMKGDEPKAGLAATLSSDRRRIVRVDHCIYGGVLLGPAKEGQSVAQVHDEHFRATAFLVRELASSFDEVAIATHPSFVDLRPFLWHNYGEIGAPTFEITLRYTSVIRLEKVSSETPLEQHPVYRRANKSRRQEIRIAIEGGIRIAARSEPSRFLELYQRTFERQQISVPAAEIELIARLLDSLQTSGRLRMFEAFTEREELASVAVFGVDSRRAYYLFGANVPAHRSSGAGTLVLWRAINALADSGLNELDLEGINSPRRGYFKTSFGGSIVPYYWLRLGSAR